MMRKPTTIEERWAWWEAAINGEPQPTHADDIHCGYFKIRKFSWAHWPSHLNPWRPARIWMRPAPIDEAGELLDDEKWFCDIDGNEADPWKAWTYLSKNPISEAEWKWLTALSPLTPKKIPQKTSQSKR